MSDERLRVLEGILDAGDAAAGLDYLISQARETGNPGLLFEAALMKKRLELGLPPIQTESPSTFPASVREVYDEAVVRAAREAGELALAAGNITGAWPYFRAIGEPARVVEAIDAVEPGENIEGVISIAFEEGVHPAKGLQLILAQHGICRALTAFGMVAVQQGRAECIAVLARNLHQELRDRLGSAIALRESAIPESASIAALIAEREWLFGEYDSYIDTSHLMSILPYCTEVKDRELLGLFHEFCVYGQRLSSTFQPRGQEPFGQPFIGYGHYIAALLGVDVEQQIAYFEDKIRAVDPEEAGTAPAQVLINLLVQLERFEEAIAVSVEHLSDTPYEISCPSILQLCHMAKNYARMKEVAQSRGDLLSYVAASVMARAVAGN